MIKRKRRRATGEFGSLPGRTEVSLWFHEWHQAEDSETKRYYKNLLGRKLSALAQNPVKSYSWASNQDDLLGAAYEGLAAAINTFDTTKGDNFYYWAPLYINVKLGREKHAEKKWLDIIQRNVPTKEEDDEIIYLEDTVPDGRLSPEEEMLKKEFWRLALGSLDKLPKEILVGTLGLDGEEVCSVRQLAKKLGVSRNKVVRIQKETMTRIVKLYKSYANMAA